MELYQHFLWHDDVIKWKHFPRYWPFVNSPHKGQWRGAFMFSFICAWTNGWENNRDAGDLRRHHAQYGVAVMDFSTLRWYNELKSFIVVDKYVFSRNSHYGCWWPGEARSQGSNNYLLSYFSRNISAPDQDGKLLEVPRVFMGCKAVGYNASPMP